MHLSGITPALGYSCRETVQKALVEAKNAGLTVSFDVNYRSRLWSPSAAYQTLTPLLNVDIVFCTLEDAHVVFGQTGTPSDIAAQLLHLWGAKMVVLTLGGDGAIVTDGNDTWVGTAHRVNPVDRVGAGDAYVAGFLCGYLEKDIDRAVAYGGAMAAWKYSEPGDFCYARRADIDALLSDAGKDIRR
jgi:2-dehydro-3-deoxygluconokinase